MVNRRLEVTQNDCFPAYVVWELTLACDQPCAHCGSRAGAARQEELDLNEALEVVKQLADMKAKEVVLIGGEAYLYDGFLDIISALKKAGIRPIMTTGGRGITQELAQQMKDAGLHSVSVSIDGLESEHNGIRKAKGSFESATATLGHLRNAGILTAANTNINRVNAPVLEELYGLLKSLGVKAWQVQITVPLGRAADRPQMLLQPYDLLKVVPRVAALKKQAFKDGILIMPGNNFGYFGVEEQLMRSALEGGQDHWRGCQAGKLVMGIESNGDVKGCPSLQSADYVGGNLKKKSLRTIWDETPELAFTRERGVDSLWGYCRSCVFAETCKAGCSFTAHALFGRPGNNPYCHFRAQQFAKDGKRERLVPTQPAQGKPFDHGLFEIQLEALDAEDEGLLLPQKDLVQISRKPKRAAVG